MTVSVVIPCYNEEKYIGKCLESIASQTEKPDEVIVVDNNCVDETVEIAQKFGARIVKEEKQGMIFSRNAGFDAARYKIIGRIDADTILPNDWVLKVKENFKNPNLVAISGPIYIKNKKFYFASIILFRFLSFLVKHNVLLGANIALRKSAWENIKNDVCLKDKDVHEDIDLAIHIFKEGEIQFDQALIVGATRFRFLRFFTEYVVRLIEMLFIHRKIILQKYLS